MNLLAVHIPIPVPVPHVPLLVLVVLVVAVVIVVVCSNEWEPPPARRVVKGDGRSFTLECGHGITVNWSPRVGTLVQCRQCGGKRWPWS
jgi:hypothetical protein